MCGCVGVWVRGSVRVGVWMRGVAWVGGVGAWACGRGCGCGNGRGCFFCVFIFQLICFSSLFFRFFRFSHFFDFFDFMFSVC